MAIVAALFDHYRDGVAAVKELEDSGIPKTDLSIVANNAEKWLDANAPGKSAKDAGASAWIGAAMGGTGGLLAGLGTLAVPGVGPVVAAGWLIAAAAGGIVSAMTESGVPADDANVYAEGVLRGGTLVTARVVDNRVSGTKTILQRYRAIDIDCRRAAYRAAGWDGFDENAPAYTDAQIREERNRYR